MDEAPTPTINGGEPKDENLVSFEENELATMGKGEEETKEAE